jgi:outer membrane biosynthesis protein TonB
MTRPELEELRARRAKLEEETRSLKRKQKKLEDGVLILEERINIEELEKRQKALQKTVSSLETKKNSLESKLQKDPTEQKTQKKISKKKAVRKPKKKKNAIANETGVTITAVVDQPLQKQKTVNTSRKRSNKKKRFFF